LPLRYFDVSQCDQPRAIVPDRAQQLLSASVFEL